MEYICSVKKKMKVLFLEDEKELVSAVSLLLEEQGYAVDTALSAEDALIMVRRSPPDLFLVDVKLPGIDGFEFLQQVHGMDQCKTVPFVFLTAFNNLQAMLEAKRQGAVEYITKPFDFEYLAARIRE